MFLLQAQPGRPLDVDAIRDKLEAIGVSVLVAGDTRALKVHVHNERPDEVIALGLGFGSLSRISVENLDNQARDVREARATEFTGAGADGTAPAPEAPPTPDKLDPNAVAPPSATRWVVRQPSPAADANGTEEPTRSGPAVVAVVAGEGLGRIFEEFGVEQVIQGGQTANTSTGELVDVARLARNREVIILPNNPNIRLAAEMACRICEEKQVVVVPTRNAAEGIAALLALDPTLDAAANVGPMTAAARGLQTFQVTEAVRNATIGGTKVKRGQTIVLDPDDGLIAVDGNRDKALLKGIAALKPGFELVTLYYGSDATLAEAEDLSRKIGAAAAGAEVEVVHGGQPHYRYLVSAE
jgi:dihydroxyacetone kinase-like predicted kinase